MYQYEQDIAQLRGTVLLELQRNYPHLVTFGIHQGSRSQHGFDPGEPRPYQDGDDLRYIDVWATSRTPPGVLMIRPRQVEHDASALVLADLDKRSMWAGSNAVMYGTDTVRAVTTAVCCILDHQDDAYGLYYPLPDDGEFRLIPPNKGKQHYDSLASLIKHTEVRQSETLSGLLEGPAHHRHRKELVVIVSAFRGRDWHDTLRVLASKYEVLAIHVLDDWAKEMPNVGPYRVGSNVIHTEDEAVRVQYNTNAAKWRAETKAVIREANAQYLETGTGYDWLEPLIRLLSPQRNSVAQSERGGHGVAS